jgi:hypothetical protein
MNNNMSRNNNEDDLKDSTMKSNLSNKDNQVPIITLNQHMHS